MRKIGITGGVGAGKSEIMAYLVERYGAVILRADDIGHQMMEKGSACYDRILQVFGPEVVTQEGQIDRRYLAERVFQNAELLQTLNSIIHPAVRQYVEKSFAEEDKKGTPFVFLEAALLVEEKYGEICDELWYVYADETVRAKRLMASRHYSPEKIRNMMDSQLSEEEYRRACAFTIDNSADFCDTTRQIDQRMKTYEIV